MTKIVLYALVRGIKAIFCNETMHMAILRYDYMHWTQTNGKILCANMYTF